MTPAPTVHASVRALKQQGDKAYGLRDFAIAIDRYSEALDSIEDVVVLSNRSATYAQRRRFDKALNDAERALKLEPSWPRLHHRHGHALFHVGRYSAARQAFEFGLRLDPDDSALIDGLAKLEEYTEPAESDNVGEVEPDQAPAAVEPAPAPAAAEPAPAAPAPQAAAPASQTAAPTPPAAATEVASPSGAKPGAFSSRAGATAAAAPPPSTPASQGGASGNSTTSSSPTAQGASGNSATSSSPPAQDGPTAADLREKGNNAFRAGKFSAAIRAYDEAIRLDEKDARSWANRAAAQMSLLAEFGRGMPPEKLKGNPYYNNALNDLTKALAVDSKYVKAFARKGQLLCMVGDLRGACNAYERGLMVDPDNKECQAGKANCRAQGA